jgi:aromatic ring-opening dioxygenase catalytic subunit (LigB family)
MGTIVAGLASSHAFTLIDPAHWDNFRERNRAGYARRYGVQPPVHPNIDRERPDENVERFRRITGGLEQLRKNLERLKPDALIVIGDDQDENYKADNLPQMAIYLGDEFLAVDRFSGCKQAYRCDTKLADEIFNGCVEAGFDMSSSKTFAGNELLSHAHAPPLYVLSPDAAIPVVLLFVNAIHVPAVNPARCYQLGETLRRIIEAGPARRVALYASGGLSHFTAGYPWPHYKGTEGYGGICEDYDRRVLKLMAEGRGAEVAKASSDELLLNGEVELRSWITLLGSLGGTPAQVLAYEPFYRAIMGMAVSWWDPEGRLGYIGPQ